MYQYYYASPETSDSNSSLPEWLQSFPFSPATLPSSLHQTTSDPGQISSVTEEADGEFIMSQGMLASGTSPGVNMLLSNSQSPDIAKHGVVKFEDVQSERNLVSLSALDLAKYMCLIKTWFNIQTFKWNYDTGHNWML